MRPFPHCPLPDAPIEEHFTDNGERLYRKQHNNKKVAMRLQPSDIAGTDLERVLQQLKRACHCLSRLTGIGSFFVLFDDAVIEVC